MSFLCGNNVNHFPCQQLRVQGPDCASRVQIQMWALQRVISIGLSSLPFLITAPQGDKQWDGCND